jgi:hypothetical protein
MKDAWEMRLAMHKIVIGIIFVMFLASNASLDRKREVAPDKLKLQRPANWSESIGTSVDRDFNGTLFNGSISNTIHSIQDFLEKRNLDIHQSENGRFEVFYKIN